MRNFTSVPNQVYSALEKGDFNHSEFFVYMLLLKSVGWEDGICKQTCAERLMWAANRSMPLNTIKHALNSLAKKGWITLDNTPGQRGSYPIVIHNYVPTMGVLKGTLINKKEIKNYDFTMNVDGTETALRRHSGGSQDGTDEGTEATRISDEEIMGYDYSAECVGTDDGTETALRRHSGSAEAARIQDIQDFQEVKIDKKKTDKRKIDRLIDSPTHSPTDQPEPVRSQIEIEAEWERAKKAIPTLEAIGWDISTFDLTKLLDLCIQDSNFADKLIWFAGASRKWKRDRPITSVDQLIAEWDEMSYSWRQYCKVCQSKEDYDEFKLASYLESLLVESEAYSN